MRVVLIYDSSSWPTAIEFKERAIEIRPSEVEISYDLLDATRQLDLEVELAGAEYIVIFWSPGLVGRRLAESFPSIVDDLLANHRVLSVFTKALPTWHLSELQAVEVEVSPGMDEPSLKDDFWKIYREIATAAGLACDLDGSPAHQSSGANEGETRAAFQYRRRYDFRELSVYLDQAKKLVGDFGPDVLFSFDARGGMWAEQLAERLGLQVPVIVGFRLKPTGPRKAAGKKVFDCCHLLETTEAVPDNPMQRRPRWHLFVPPALLHLPQSKKVLFVDDYSTTGETCAELKRFLIDKRGFPPANLRTMTLVTTTAARVHGKAPDFSLHETPAERADLFYMFRR